MRSPGVRPSAAGRGVEPSSWERLWEPSGWFQKRGPRLIERELAVWINVPVEERRQCPEILSFVKTDVTATAQFWVLQPLDRRW